MCVDEREIEQKGMVELNASPIFIFIKLILNSEM